MYYPLRRQLRTVLNFESAENFLRPRAEEKLSAIQFAANKITLNGSRKGTLPEMGFAKTLVKQLTEFCKAYRNSPPQGFLPTTGSKFLQQVSAISLHATYGKTELFGCLLITHS